MKQSLINRINILYKETLVNNDPYYVIVTSIVNSNDLKLDLLYSNRKSISYTIKSLNELENYIPSTYKGVILIDDIKE